MAKSTDLINILWYSRPKLLWTWMRWFGARFSEDVVGYCLPRRFVLEARCLLDKDNQIWEKRSRLLNHYLDSLLKFYESELQCR